MASKIKLTNLQHYKIQKKIDIALIGETKIKPSVPLKITNYISYHTDNTTYPGRIAKGGTAILIHRRITHRQIKLNTLLNSTSIGMSFDQDQIKLQNPLVPSDLDLTVVICS